MDCGCPPNASAWYRPSRGCSAVMASQWAPAGVSLAFFFFQAEDGIRDYKVTGVQTCALPILGAEEALPPLAARAALRDFHEQAETLVLPALDHGEVTGIVLDERLDQRARIADVAGDRGGPPAAVARGGGGTLAALPAAEGDGREPARPCLGGQRRTVQVLA